MTKHVTPATATFTGANGNKLVADVFGETGAPVILLHGGGQTRHAWRATASELARTRLDGLRDRSARPRRFRMGARTAPMRFRDFAADVKAVATELTRRARQQAGRDRRFARRHRVDAGGRRELARQRRRICSPRSCWSISPRASTTTASPRCRASCARMRRKALPRSRTRPTRSRNICRIGRARRATKA